jgi:hypothetical protein
MSKAKGYQFKSTKSNHSRGDVSIDLTIDEVSIPESPRPIGVLTNGAFEAPGLTARNEQLILASLTASADWVSSSELLDQMNAQGMRKTSFYEARKALISDGKVVERRNARGSDLKVSSEFAFATTRTDSPNPEPESPRSVRSQAHSYGSAADELNELQSETNELIDSELF